MLRARLSGSLATILVLNVLLVGYSEAQEYGHTEFQASGSEEARAVFIKGLLQLQNFEYPGQVC